MTVNTSLMTGPFMPSADDLEHMAAAGNTLSIFLSYFKVTEEIGRAIMMALEISDDDRYSIAAGLTDEELEEVIRSIVVEGNPRGWG